MTPQEKITAKKTARIIRTLRKKRGITQVKLAQELGLSQSNLSKIENALLMPSAMEWVHFCRFAEISTESLLTGHIESVSPVKVLNGNLEGDFKVPPFYSVNRGSKIRSMLPFVSYMGKVAGEEAVEEYFKAIHLDSDFFVDLDHQINLLFCLELCRALIGRGLLNPRDLAKLVAPVASREIHGNLHTRYEKRSNPLTRLEALLKNSRFYECNFIYSVESRSGTQLEFSVTPAPHLESREYRDDPELGDFLCQYKKEYFNRFTGSSGKKNHGSAKLTELECHYKGAEKCIYRMATI